MLRCEPQQASPCGIRIDGFGARGWGSSKSFDMGLKYDLALTQVIINRRHEWDSHADTYRMRYRRFSCRLLYFTKEPLLIPLGGTRGGVSKEFLSKIQ